MAANWVRFPGGEDGAAEPTPAWPLDTVLDAAVAAGFRSVGLDHYSVDGYSAGELAALLRERGLRCSDVGVVAVGALEEAAVERLARAATALGAPLCIAALYRAAPHEEIVGDLRSAAAVLAPAGIRIAFEFTAYGNRTSLADAVAICADVGWERCGLLLDTWHVFRGGESLAEIRALGGDRIALVHVNDGAARPHEDATFEGRFLRLLPGTGSFDLDGFAGALDAAGYRGPISLEVLSAQVRQLPPAEGARLLRQAALDARLG